MGYYTDYSLSAQWFDKTHLKVEPNIPEDVAKAVDAEIGKLEVFESGEIGCGGYYGYAKWYDFEEDMLAISEKFPDVLFCLHGNGEESMDMWNAYYLQGKTQFCQARITYDEFDFAKLERP